VLPARVENHLELSQNRRMVRREALGEPGIPPIHREGVLDQVVAADTEEGAVGGELIGYEYGRRRSRS
jgi:hypothetical protein